MVLLTGEKIKNTVFEHAGFLITTAVFLCLIFSINYLFLNRTAAVDFYAYEDPSGALTVDDMIKTKSTSFEKLEKGVFPGGFSDSVWWFRMNARNAPGDCNIMSIAQMRPKTADIYYVDSDHNGHLLDQFGWGETLGLKKSVAGLSVQFEVPEEFRDNDIYYRVQATTNLIGQFELMTEKQYHIQYIRNLLVTGTMVGCLMFMLLHCIITFHPRNNRFFYTYCLFLVSAGVQVAWNFGLFLIASRLFILIQKTGMSGIITCLYIVLMQLVTLILMEIKNISPRNYKISIFLIAANIVITGCVVIAVQTLSSSVDDWRRLYLIMAWLTFGNMIYQAILVLTGRSSAAKNLSYGILLCIMGHMSAGLPLLGITQSFYVFLYSQVIGLIFMTVYYSKMVAQRISNLYWKGAGRQVLSRELEKQSEDEQASLIMTKFNKQVLFDVLKSAAELCTTKQKKVIRMLVDLSGFLNYHFNFQRSSLVYAEEELNALRTYIKLERAVGIYQFDVEFKLDKIAELMLPPMGLQILAENAIRHGLAGTRKKGKIIVTIRNRADHYQIAVWDNGVGMTEERRKEVLSRNSEDTPSKLAHYDQLLYKRYGKRLEITSTIGVGTNVMFEIPKKESE